MSEKNPKEILNKLVSEFNKAMPERKVVAVYAYKKDSILVEAPMKNEDKDCNNPYFLVTKDGLKGFSPFDDFEAFSDALDNHKIEV